THRFVVRAGPAPRAAIFPYTTLFRSEDDRLAQADARLQLLGRRGRNCRCRDCAHDGLLIVTISPARDTLVVPRHRSGLPPPPAGDRKSTRLNSSHVAISYAVFCLKKK